MTKPLDKQPLSFNNHEWIAACGHELRIPIAQIENCTEILEMDLVEQFLEPGERKQYFSDLKSANRSLSLLVEDLIDGAKNANHTFNVNCQKINLKTIIEEVHHTLTPSTKYDVAFLLDYQLEPTTFAIADPQRIKQVISNLVRNAIKFTEKGNIAIRAELISENPAFIKVSVTDSGIGMNCDQVKRVWDAFTKVYDVTSINTDKDIENGLGLGLALSSSLIAKMGGEIGVESESSIGSTFYFTIPCEC